MWWVPFLGKIVDLLFKRLDPETALEAQRTLGELELKAREAEAAAEKARADEFAAFIAATTPKSENMYMWVNSAIGLFRPAMAVFSLVAPFVWPQQWRDAVWLIAQGAPWSIMFLSPLIVWVVGRDALRMFLGLASIAKNGGKIPEEVLPPGIPPRTDRVKPVVPPTGDKARLVKPWVPPPLPDVPGDNRGDDLR